MDRRDRHFLSKENASRGRQGRVNEAGEAKRKSYMMGRRVEVSIRFCFTPKGECSLFFPSNFGTLNHVAGSTILRQIYF